MIQNDKNNQITSLKIAKFCDDCGKPLFKFHSLKIDGGCILLKIDVSCRREPCLSNGTANKTVDLKIDLTDFKNLKLQELSA